MQVDMFKSLISADTKLIDNKHSGKFITNLTNDIGMITTLLSVAILNIFKDSLLYWIAWCNVLSKLKWLYSIIMIPLASGAARTLGKK